MQEQNYTLSKLQLVSTDEIYAELKSRFDTFIMAGIQAPTDNIDNYDLRYAGVMSQCIGLCTILQNDILDKCVKNEVEKCQD